MHIGLVIPAYNNEGTLEKVLNQVDVGLSFLGQNDEVVVDVINDCSTDGTSKILDAMWTRNGRFGRSYWHTTHKNNMGVGASIKTGFQGLTNIQRYYDFIIKIDADGQHDPRLLQKMVKKLKAGADLVIASRFHKKSARKDTPVDRLLLNRVFAEVIREITGWQISDARSGFMGMRWEYALKMAEQLVTKRYGIPMEIILRIWKMKPNAKIVEIPHPALYGGNSLTKEHRRRYQSGGETIEQKAARAAEAYAAVLRVLEDMNIRSSNLKLR